MDGAATMAAEQILTFANTIFRVIRHVLIPRDHLSDIAAI
jgi:hypothetical protein